MLGNNALQPRYSLLAALLMSSPLSTLAYSASNGLRSRFPYQSPSWAKDVLTKPPIHGRLILANLPTPLYPLRSNSVSFEGKKPVLSQLEEMGISLYIKRDDMTGGTELGGNKVRKLEFLLADACALGYDSIVTIGGEQSNHCRATASAARMLGLEPHLILRTRRADVATHEAEQNTGDGFGYTGNILFDRMVGSKIYTCTPGEYGRLGSEQLVARLCSHLVSSSNGKRPYPIPVGGSNGLGSWGYINAVEELLSQWENSYSTKTLDHIVFACGSGGTAAGIVLGIALAHLHEESQTKKAMPQIHAIGVCDDPDYFYRFVAGIADEMGFQLPSLCTEMNTTEEFIRQHMTVHQGKGLGYAVSTPEELEFVTRFGIETGIVLDPVYSGKALYNFVTNVILKKSTDANERSASSFREGQNVLFWHTGGSLGLFDKGSDLLSNMRIVSPTRRIDIYGKGVANSIDISEPSE